MIRPRWQKVWADLFSHKIRSLLVIASIAVGLFAIGMITIDYVIMSEDMRNGYRAIHPANIQVRVAAFDDGIMNRLSHLPGVDEVQGARNFGLQVQTAEGEWKPISIKAVKEQDLRDQLVNAVELKAGAWPPHERQIALDVNKLDDTGAILGDMLRIKLPSGLIREIELSAVVRDQTIGSASGEGGYFLAPIQGYVTFDTLTWLEQPQRYNTLYATVETAGEDQAAIRTIADDITREFTRHDYISSSSIVRLSSQHPNLTYVDAMTAVIFLLGFLVVFLSGFLITNTLSALMNQQGQQIGIMKTFGGTRRQIIGIYMLLILVFSLIALAIAIPASQWAAFALLDYLGPEINFEALRLRTVPSAILLQAVIALLVPQIAGSVPILQGTRISVREALSGDTSSKIDDAGPLYRLLARVRGLSRPLLISLRNTFRRRARLALTLITLALGGSIFIATFNLRYSVENYILRLGQYFVADVNLTFSEPYRVDRIQREVMQVQGVAQVEGWNGAMAQIVRTDGIPGESVQVLAPPAESQLIHPIMLAGRWIQPGDQNAIVLSEIFKDHIPGLQVGDRLRLKIGYTEKDWVIVGFFQFAGRSAGLFAYANYDYLSRETGMFGSAAFFRLVGSGQDLSLAEQEELASRVEDHLTARGFEISEVTAGLYLQERTSKGLDVLTTFLLIMSLLLASVGSIGLMGTMSLNVMERTREIGVMRAIGGSDRAIFNIILVEGGLIGFISWLLACVAALPISKILGDQIFQIIFNLPADITFTLSGNLIWLGAVLLLAVLASIIPAFNATRLTIREVLAYE